MSKASARWRGPKASVVVSKLEAAEAHFKAAVELYLCNGNIVPVLTLANAAREVVASLGERGQVKTLHDDLAEVQKTTTRELIKDVSKIAGFLKHADRDPTGTVEVNEDTVAAVLQLACHDFGRVKGEMPIEAQIYEAWSIAATVERVSEAPMHARPVIRKLLQMMPGLRSADWSTRRRSGCGY